MKGETSVSGFEKMCPLKLPFLGCFSSYYQNFLNKATKLEVITEQLKFMHHANFENHVILLFRTTRKAVLCFFPYGLDFRSNISVIT